MTMQIRIITDDFTSALDGTACFAERGWETVVLTRAYGTVNAAVVSRDTNTREHGDAGRGDIVAESAQIWRDADILALQFDSTLRGRVVRDCTAALAASGRSKLLIAPAFPSAGRTTESGRVLVNGAPVHETAFGRDPTLPVRESSLPALFRAHDIAVATACDASHARVLLDTYDAVVVDARSEAELESIAKQFTTRTDLLWAGSTGLLRAFARTLPVPSAPADSHAIPIAVRPWLIVGSINPRSRRQLEVARAHCRINILATGNNRLPGAPSARGALSDLVLQTTNLLKSGICDGLVVTGGETARRIVDALPGVSLHVHREILPGVPLAEVRTANGSFPMITKAGGFGDDDALLTCLNVLNGARP